MKIEMPGVGRPLLGPAKISSLNNNSISDKGICRTTSATPSLAIRGRQDVKYIYIFGIIY